MVKSYLIMVSLVKNDEHPIKRHSHLNGINSLDEYIYDCSMVGLDDLVSLFQPKGFYFFISTIQARAVPVRCAESVPEKEIFWDGGKHVPMLCQVVTLYSWEVNGVLTQLISLLCFMKD